MVDSETAGVNADDTEASRPKVVGLSQSLAITREKALIRFAQSVGDRDSSLCLLLMMQDMVLHTAPILFTFFNCRDSYDTNYFQSLPIETEL